MKSLAWILAVSLFAIGCTSKKEASEEIEDSGEAKVTEASGFDAPRHQQFVLDGTINQNLPIVIYLSISDNKATGKYFYKKIQDFITLDGLVRSDSVFLTERNGEIVTGYFDLSLNALPDITGIWKKPESNSRYSVKLIHIKPFSPAIPIQGTGVQKAVKPNSDSYEVLFNLNGILTEAVYDVDEQGFRSAIYTTTSISSNKPITFTDIFKPEARETIKQLIKSKIVENCPEQFGSGAEITDEALTE
ncbi:MAG: hypothetical protein HC811_08885, partial [Flammeovirgaceae bacterium]|nr:hypothetical protein [Flammeovirgaceae bacterium]